eukprot:g11319.t1
MKGEADPEIFLAGVQDLANKLHYLGESVSAARLDDIVLQGLPPSNDQLRLMVNVDSGFTFAKIERIARNEYKSRSRGRLQQRHHQQRDTHARDSDTGVVLTDPMTKCDTCPVSKSIQQAHRNTADHKATVPLERVCTDIIGPISPPAKGGYRYVSKFTDELTRCRAVQPARGGRASVHDEHHREKLQDRAWEGRLVGHSKDSRAYRIYNSRTRQVVETRNVTFIETPDAPLPPAAADRESPFPPNADSMGNLYFGDDSDSDSSVDSGDDGDTEGSDAEMDEHPIEPDGHERRPPDGKDRQIRSRGQLTHTTSRDLSAKQRRALRQLAITVSSNATSPFVPPASIPTPNTFKQAIQSPFRAKWKAAMEKELQSLKEHEVADIVITDTLPPGASPIGSRWVFKVEPDSIFKARLVVQGYGQRHGIDCGGTFVSVCRTSSQRTLQCIAASKGLHVEHLDVKTAFLKAPVEGDLWVYQAPGFEENDPVTATRSPAKLSGNTYVVLSIYVDDVLLLGVDPSIVRDILEQLMNKFSMPNLGSASLELGMEIEQVDGYIKVS